MYPCKLGWGRYKKPNVFILCSVTALITVVELVEVTVQVKREQVYLSVQTLWLVVGFYLICSLDCHLELRQFLRTTSS